MNDNHGRVQDSEIPESSLITQHSAFSTPHSTLIIPHHGRLMALDVGEKRVGLAVCDEMQTLASPLTVVTRRSRGEDVAVLKRVAAEQAAVGLVVGHPQNADGSAGPQARQAVRYGHRLANALGLPVVLQDEYGSSQEAAERLAHAAKSRRRAPIDAEAAAVILQDYLDNRVTLGDEYHNE